LLIVKFSGLYLLPLLRGPALYAADIIFRQDLQDLQDEFIDKQIVKNPVNPVHPVRKRKIRVPKHTRKQKNPVNPVNPV
jgi:hypothetical protein